MGVISKPLEHFSKREMAARRASPERTAPEQLQSYSPCLGDAG
jgi:hypothetical protein